MIPSRRSARSHPEQQPKRNPKTGMGAVNECQQNSDTSDREFDMLRTKTLDVTSVRSVLITKLRTKTSQKHYRIDSCYSGNLMPISCLKLISQCKTNKTKKGKLHAYNNSSIPQLGICRVKIRHKDVELP